MQLEFGTSSDAAFEYDTAQTPDSLVLGVGLDSNTFLLIQEGDIDFDFAHALAPDPTFCVHSANQSTTEYLCMTHDQTDALISSGTNTMKLVTSSGTWVDVLNLGAAFKGNMSIEADSNFDVGNIGGLLQYDATETNDTFKIAPGNDSKTIALVERADINANLSLPVATNPTLHIHSNDATDTTKWLKLTHDGVNAVYSVGTGLHQLSGNVEVTGQSYSTIPATLTPTGTTQTVDFDNGNGQIIDLESATGDVTLTLSNPKAGASYVIKVIQDSTTPRDLVWPASVLWSDGVAIVITTTGDAEDLVTLFYDGTNYYGSYAQDFQ